MLNMREIENTGPEAGRRGPDRADFLLRGDSYSVAMGSNGINIPVPEWARGRQIVVMAGREPFLVYSPEKGKWYRKTVRCNLCGKCCRNIGMNWPWRNESGDCGYLKREVWNFPPFGGREVFICTNPLSPVSCVFSNVPGRPHPDCCIEYEEVR